MSLYRTSIVFLGGLAAVCVASSAWGQSSVSSVSTREGSQSTARTGAPDYSVPATVNTPHGWPLPNGQGWTTLGQPLSVAPSYSVGQTFAADQLTPVVPPAPRYTNDRQGNEIYTDPSTGLSQTYGTTIRSLK